MKKFYIMERGLHRLNITYFDSLEDLNKTIEKHLDIQDLPYYTNGCKTLYVVDYYEED